MRQGFVFNNPNAQEVVRLRKFVLVSRSTAQGADAIQACSSDVFGLAVQGLEVMLAVAQRLKALWRNSSPAKAVLTQSLRLRSG